MGFVNPDHLTAIMQSKDLTANESWLLTVLCCHFPSIRPSYERLIQMTKLSRRTIIRSINELTDRGIILVEKRPGRASIYSINFEALQGGATVTPPSTKGCQGGTGRGARVTPQGCQGGTGRGATVAPEVNNKGIKEVKNTPLPPVGEGVVISASMQAEELCTRFYDEWGHPGLKPRERQKEIEHVEEIIRRFGHMIADKAARRLPALLHKRWPECKRLSGAWAYLDDLVASEKKIADHQAAVEADRLKREQDQAASAAATEAAERSFEHQRAIWESLPPCQRSAYEANVLAKHGRLHTPGTRIFLHLCFEEMARSPPPSRKELGGIFAEEDLFRNGGTVLIRTAKETS